MLKKIAYSVLGVIVASFLIYKSLNSDFAKAHESFVPEDTEAKRKSNKVKSKNSNERFYTTKFKKNEANTNIISLGDFTINIDDDKKLIMKVSVEANEDMIDEIANYQAVIRNDVVQSVNSASNFEQGYLSRKIIQDINRRFEKGRVDRLYFENFIIQ